MAAEKSSFFMADSERKEVLIIELKSHYFQVLRYRVQDLFWLHLNILR